MVDIIPYSIVTAPYLGIGATLGFFLCTYPTRRTVGRADKQKCPRATTLGLPALGTLIGGALDSLVTWLSPHKLAPGTTQTPAPTVPQITDTRTCVEFPAPCFDLLPAARPPSKTFHLLNRIVHRPVTRPR